MRKKLVLLLAATMVLCGSLGLASACKKDNNDSSGTEVPPADKGDYEYGKGDSIVDDKDVQYTVDEDGNIKEVQYTGKDITVKYLVGDSSYVTLSGKKAEEMSLDGYSGDVTKISLAEIENAVKIGNTSISVVSVKDKAFFGCDTLESVDLTKANKSLSFNIGKEAFDYCTGLTSVVLPANVYTDRNSVGAHAFRGCSSLVSVNFGNNFSTVGEGAFESCTSLVQISLPSKLTKIENNTFYDCESLSTVSYPDSVRSIGNSAFQGTALSTLDLSGKTKLTYIGSSAFSETNLTSVSIPDNVTYIGSRAFYDCKSLNSVDIPFLGTTVSSTGSWNFNNVYGLKSYDTDSLRSINVKVRGTAVIPAGAFQNSYDVTSISIKYTKDGKVQIYKDDGISYSREDVTVNKNINDNAFNGCIWLSSLSIPSGITEIGNNAFKNCYRLNALPSLTGVTAIGDSAFEGCRQIDSITIPDSVKTLGNRAFADCVSLSTLEFKQYFSTAYDWLGNASTTSFGQISRFFGTYPSEEIFGSMYPANSVYLPMSLDTVKIGGLHYLPNNMFNGWEYLNKADLTFTQAYNYPDNQDVIGSSAFRNCATLRTLTLHDEDNVITSIGQYAFSGCQSLPAAPVTEYVEKIGSYAFEDCYEFGSFTVPEGIKSVGSAILKGCMSLESLTIEGYDKTIYNYYSGNVYYAVPVAGLFSTEINYGMYNANGYYIPDGLTKVTLGKVTSLADNAFNGWSSLDTVNMDFETTLFDGNNVYYTQIGNYAFNGCDNLTKLNITGGDRVSRIGNYAFAGCEKLTFSQVAALTNYTYLGTRAFANCVSLGDVTIPASLSDKGNNVFYNCAADYNCSGITSLTFENYSAFADYFNNSNTNVIASLFGANSSDYYDVDVYYASVNTGNGTYYVPFSLTSITLNQVNYNIRDYAFYNMSTLTEINVNAYDEDTLVLAGKYAFYNCSALTELPDVVFTTDSTAALYGLNSSAFDGADLKFVLPDYYTFYGRTYVLASLFSTSANLNTNSGYLPETLTSVILIAKEYANIVPSRMFHNANYISSIAIDNSYAEIFKSVTTGSYAFYNCSALTELSDVEFTTGSTSALYGLNNAVFEGATLKFNLPYDYGSTYLIADLFGQSTNANLPSTLTSVSLITENYINVIPSRMFYNAAYVTSVEFDSDLVSEIGAEAFTGSGVQFETRGGMLVFNNWVVEFADTSSTEIILEADFSCKGFANGTLNNITAIYFLGTKEDEISIGASNATVYYYTETDPDCYGPHWTYGADGEKQLWQYTAKTYTLDYNNVLDAEEAEYAVIYSNTLTIPVAEGYSFMGWYLDEAYTQLIEYPYYNNTGITIYAKFVEVLTSNTNDSSYHFIEYKDNYGNVTGFNSTNKGNDAKNSSSTYTITAFKDITISFDYSVSSENTYDWFTITHYSNGSNEQIAKISGTDSGSAKILMSAGDYITFEYSKDNSNNDGSDCGYVYNIVIEEGWNTEDEEFEFDLSEIVGDIHGTEVDSNRIDEILNAYNSLGTLDSFTADVYSSQVTATYQYDFVSDLILVENALGMGIDMYVDVSSSPAKVYMTMEGQWVYFYDNDGTYDSLVNRGTVEVDPVISDSATSEGFRYSADYGVYYMVVTDTVDGADYCAVVVLAVDANDNAYFTIAYYVDDNLSMYIRYYELNSTVVDRSLIDVDNAVDVTDQMQGND